MSALRLSQLVIVSIFVGSMSDSRNFDTQWVKEYRQDCEEAMNQPECAEGCGNLATPGSQFCSVACASRAAIRQRNEFSKAAQPESKAAQPTCRTCSNALINSMRDGLPSLWRCRECDAKRHDALPVEPPAAQFKVASSDYICSRCLREVPENVPCPYCA